MMRSSRYSPTGLGVIWKSIDVADTWQRLGTLPAGSDPSFLPPQGLDPSLFFASTRVGLVKSQNAGETWTVVTEYPLLAEYPFRLLIDPQSRDTFYLVNWLRQRLHLE